MIALAELRQMRQALDQAAAVLSNRQAPSGAKRRASRSVLEAAYALLALLEQLEGQDAEMVP